VDVIRIGDSVSPLAPLERFALATLLDASRLLRAEDPTADVVELRISADSEQASLTAIAAPGWAPGVVDGAVQLSVGTLRTIGGVLTAALEQTAPRLDRFGRVPSTENALVRAGLERTPVVSRAALALREAATRAAGRRIVRLLPAWPDGRSWAAALTHDLDVVQWWPLFSVLRVVELVRARVPRDAARTLAAAAKAIAGDPVLRAITQLLDIERGAAVRSTWFVLAGRPTIATMVAGDITYRPDHPRARTILTQIAMAKGEVGLHGSFATYENADAMRAERATLRTLTGAAVSGVRQHFLRMRPPATLRAMVSSAFTYDATFGFADRSGFRLGVADIVQAWSVPANQPLPIDLVPLIWMDRALSKYRGIHRPAAWVDEAIELATTCRDVEGLWVGLWHPNLSPALGFPGAPREYARLVRWLTEQTSPYVGTLDELTTWRRERRLVRALRVASDGRIELRSPRPFDLLDERGRTVAA
jgi:hypothetical protein